MKMFDGRCILKPLERLNRCRSSTTPTTEDSLVIQPLERLGYPLLNAMFTMTMIFNLRDYLILSPTFY